MSDTTGQLDRNLGNLPLLAQPSRERVEICYFTVRKMRAEESKAAFVHVIGADEALARERGGGYAAHRGPSGMCAFGPRATLGELQRPRGQAAGESLGRRDLFGGHRVEPGGRDCAAERTCDTRRVKSCTMKAPASSGADTSCDLYREDVAQQQVATRQVSQRCDADSGGKRRRRDVDNSSQGVSS